MLNRNFPSVYARLQGTLRQGNPKHSLSTVWHARPETSSEASRLHPVLADRSLLSLERPAPLDVERLLTLPFARDDQLEPVVEMGQMHQNAASVCFVVPLHPGNDEALARTLQSVFRQTAPDWEVLLCGPADADVGAWLEVDWRVRRFVSHSEDTSASLLTQAVVQATTRFIGLVSQGDVLDDDLVKLMSAKVRELPMADVIYADEANRCKPDGFAEHQQFLNMPGRFVAVRKSLALQSEPPRSGNDEATEHEVVLSIMRRARKIVRIDEPRCISTSTPQRAVGWREGDGVNDAAAEALSERTYFELLARLEEGAKAAAPRLGLVWDDVMLEAPEEHSTARQALTILMLGLFDEAWYLSTYSDVKAAGLEPIVHYVNLGDAEGRRPNAYFDPAFYRAQFKAAPPQRSVCALYHYARLGEAIGLDASRSFSPRRYLAANAQLDGWLDKPLTHFLHLGRKGGLMANHRSRLSSLQSVQFEKRCLPTSPGHVDPKHGINVIGPLDRISGLGVSARGYLEGLRLAGFTRLGCRVQQREFAIQKSIQDSPVFPPFLPDARVNVVHMNGDTLPVMIKTHGDGLLQARYNIAVWYWELPTLRPEWQASMKYFHEFWAPTPFIARALGQSTDKPVRLVPPYLSYLANLKSSGATRTGPSHFVYCFDANSILERKNPGALLDAFQAAFPAPSSDARLTFKVTYPNRKIAEVDRLYEAAARDPRIHLIDRMMSDADLHALIGSASAYVSPHRSEGLGLTVIEAMGAGVPVIATPFGGVDAFVTTDAAYPIHYGHVELAEDYIPYPQGFVWADPDIGSLADQLMRVHCDRHDALQRAAVARQRVLEYFCSPELAATYARELGRIAAL